MIIPNKDLSDVKVINHGEMYHRRIDWKINLVYSTTLEQLKEICSKIDEFIKDYEGLVENVKQESFAKTVPLIQALSTSKYYVLLILVISLSSQPSSKILYIQ